MGGVVISPEELAEIANEIWVSYLDPSQEQPLLPAPVDRPGGVSAAVTVSGAWHGQVVVECSLPASRAVAAALMGVWADDVTGEDVADALGELANMIGGNVKSLLPAPATLSLPHVVLAADGTGRPPAGTEVCRLAATWLDEPVSISVLERSAQPDAAATA